LILRYNWGSEPILSSRSKKYGSNTGHSVLRNLSNFYTVDRINKITRI